MNTLNERLGSLASAETGAPYVRRLATLLKALVVILLASTAAQLTWFFLADPPVPLKSAGVTAPVGATKTETLRGSSLQNPKTTLSDLAKSHLFGTPPATEQRQSAVPTEAPKTRLNLRLTGILAIGGDGQGVAIIARGNEQRVYTTGANLPGNAILKYVHRDRVILSRAGRFEMLLLSRDKLELSQTDAGVQAASPGEFPVDGSARDPEPVETEQSHIPRNELTQLREELNNDPRRLADLIQFTPIMSEDGIRGFRIQPRSAGRDYFQRAGLEEDDIVTAVNGIPVSDMQQMSGLVNQLETVRELRLQVERGGREQQLVVGID
ncbi:type II secretion system protein GspC [Thiohalophilus sp.]|uniref:type II secretion system protein GspC n=1 Tax=Thiohalophilus sp. TaxID=3028392 RepID=UPI002ACEE916|nr:type II secretion system protein GspC [Thiohalophilus sp.]MDZ7662385.1 type II secretion system protein GspC [Thiohalophilus sp.]